MSVMDFVSKRQFESHRAAYRFRVVWKIRFLAFLSFVTVVFVVIDLLLGAHTMTLRQIFTGLFRTGNATELDKLLIWDVRLPISLMAPLVGAVLGLAGAQMQTVLKNPLADPYTFGVSASASFGAGLVLIFGISFPFFPPTITIPIMALISSFLTILFIFLLSHWGRLSTEAVSLLGVALMFIFHSLLTFMQFVSSETQLQSLTFWSMGSLNKTTWIHILVLLLGFILSFYKIMRYAWMLTSLSLEDAKVDLMGMDSQKVRFTVLLIVAFLSSLSVAFVGSIGFIGLVAPHLARIFVGEDQRFFIGASALFGALLMTVSAILSKAFIPGAILPLTVVTSFIGVPFLIFLILKRRGIR